MEHEIMMREAPGIYVTCNETLAWVCPFCGNNVEDASETIPHKCKKCGAVFVIKVIGYATKQGSKRR